MNTNTVIRNNEPLKPDYIPETVVGRDRKITELSSFTKTSGRNLLLHGPRGTGKTTITHHHMNGLENYSICRIPCDQYTTQYKTLKHIYKSLTQENIGTGYHTSDLQRKIRERTGHTPTAIILDEVDFLLLNDGDSLLYYLSRLENQENISIILVSSNSSSLKQQVEERTYSSLQPHRISFEPYTAETLYQILKDRAKKSLKPQTLRREAVHHIAATARNASEAITWLRTAAENTEQTITEQTVADIKDQAYRNYVDHLLQPFTEHHRLLHQAIEELTEETGSETVNTGDIYNRYQKLCQTYSEDSLSNRRLSDFLKHLELLNLINAKYHYGGNNGKTREIQLTSSSGLL